MDVRELRIGNWVNWRGDLNEIVTHAQIQAFGDEYEPIPIDESILLKAGFEKTDEDNYFQQKYWYHKILDFKISVYTEECCIKTNGISLFYLHQLQNWIYINTGTELNIQL